MAIELKLSSGDYVYTISVSDIVSLYREGKRSEAVRAHEIGQEPPQS
jgi:hypothetical protein